MTDSTREARIETETGKTRATPQTASASSAIKKFSLLMALNWACLAGLALVTFFNIIGPEYFWVTSFNLYLPQWLWLLPGIPLWIATATNARRKLWLPTLCLLWTLGPIMGFCWSFPWHRAAATDLRLRVLTYNVKAGHRDANAIVQEIYTTRPDLILCQERGGILDRGLKPLLTGWYISSQSQYMIASRYPIVAAEIRPLHGVGFSNDCMRCQVQIGSSLITVYTAHFLSPRGGLAAVRHHRLEGIDILQGGASTRLGQAERLAEYVRQEQGPVLVGGDLNAPVQSVACKTLFDAGLSDAFSDAGRGYGYTYGKTTKLGMSYVRIDHIMISAQWQAQACWPGNDQGSDHRPVIADLTLPRAP
jgi:endonuclease/exonuclease/phosphatase (EEP) superfamily protein YafD